MSYAYKKKSFGSVYLLGLFVSLMVYSSTSFANSFGIGLNFSYNKGNQGYYSPIYGQPVFGYGNGSYLGGCGGMWGPGGMMGGGGMIGGGMPSLPPVMPPMLPPHLSMPNQGWGPGYGSYPGPFAPTGPMCGVPCGAGMMPQQMYPVPGGPVMLDSGMYGQAYGMSGGGMAGGGGSYVGGGQSVYSVNGQTVIDLTGSSKNAWEIDDSGSVVWATALGLGMQTSNVYPLAFPRNQPPFMPTLGMGPAIQPGQNIRPQFGH